MDVIKELYSRIENVNLWDGSVLLKRNEFLKDAGAIDNNLYYILSGSLKMSIINKNKENIIRLGYKNNFMASLDSFITGKPSDFCIQAIRKTKLKFISKESHSKLINQNAETQLLWSKILEQLVLQQIEREKDIFITSPKERFKKVLERSPNLFQEVPAKYIASYLRMTPETLSRLRSLD
ncbi:MAG: Crp/Fnr family transcriptional regulator [Calditrichia bacterium]